MRNARWALVVGIMLAALHVVNAAQVELEGEAEIAVNSAFVWRGEVINDEPVINPYIAFHNAGWKLSAWGSWNLTSVEDGTEDSRVDASLECSGECNRQLFSIGSVAYVYHDDDSGGKKDTFEAFVGYRVDVPTLPSLTVYYDFGEIEGFYATFSLGHSFLLVEDRLALDVGASIGAADEEYAAAVFTIGENANTGFPGFTPDQTSWVDMNGTVDLAIEIGEQFTLMPGFRYMRVVDSDIKDALEATGLDYEQVMWNIRGTYYF